MWSNRITASLILCSSKGAIIKYPRRCSFSVSDRCRIMIALRRRWNLLFFFSSFSLVDRQTRVVGCVRADAHAPMSMYAHTQFCLVCVCVCACACVRVRECVHASVRACTRGDAGVWYALEYSRYHFSSTSQGIFEIRRVTDPTHDQTKRERGIARCVCCAYEQGGYPIHAC